MFTPKVGQKRHCMYVYLKSGGHVQIVPPPPIPLPLAVMSDIISAKIVSVVSGFRGSPKAQCSSLRAFQYQNPTVVGAVGNEEKTVIFGW